MRYIYLGLTGCIGSLIISRVAAMVGEPPKRPLNHPTLPDWNETDRAGRTIPDLQSTRKMLCRKCIQFLSMVLFVPHRLFVHLESLKHGNTHL